MNQFLLDLLSKFLQIVGVGGWMVLPLVLTSIFTLALVFEQVWYIFLGQQRLKKLVLSSGDLNQIQGMDMVSRMVSWILKHPNSLESEQKQNLSYIYNHFERRISWLNTMAAVAPLLGLLGTVSGMINIFAVVSAKKPTNPLASLSGGISEALFATAGGLLIAIIAAFSYQYLQSKLEALGEAITLWYKSYQLSLANNGAILPGEVKQLTEAGVAEKSDSSLSEEIIETKSQEVEQTKLQNIEETATPTSIESFESKIDEVIETIPEDIMEPEVSHQPDKENDELFDYNVKAETKSGELFDYNVKAKTKSGELFDFNVKAKKPDSDSNES